MGEKWRSVVRCGIEKGDVMMEKDDHLLVGYRLKNIKHELVNCIATMSKSKNLKVKEANTKLENCFSLIGKACHMLDEVVCRDISEDYATSIYYGKTLEGIIDTTKKK